MRTRWRKEMDGSRKPGLVHEARMVQILDSRNLMTKKKVSKLTYWILDHISCSRF